MSLAILEAKCKSIGAIYQVKSKPIRQLPNTSSRSIRFSGSPNPALNHIFEVTEAPNRAYVMVFSSSLLFDDNYDVLANGVNNINRDSELGIWLYEEKPGIKQFCYLVTVELGFTASSKVKSEVLWQTIVYIDRVYKEKVSLLSECQLVTQRVIPSASPDSFPASFVNSLLSQLETAYGKVTCQAQDNQLNLHFMGRFQSEKLAEKYRQFSSNLRILPETYEISIYFSEDGKPAVFPFSSNPIDLLLRLNRFNVALGVGYFIYQSEPGLVVFKYKSCRKDYHMSQLPSHFRSLFATLTAKLPAYFECVQKYFLNTPKRKEIREIREIPENCVFDIYEDCYNEASFEKELAEIAELERSKAGKYVLPHLYQVKDKSIVRKIPISWISLTSIWTEELIPTNSELQQLLHLLQDLNDSKLYYSNIQEMIYFLQEEEKSGVVLVPFSLFGHKTDKMILNELLVKICGKMQESVVAYRQILYVKTACSLLPAFDIIHPEAISTPAPGLFMMGHAKIDLTLVVRDTYVFEELHNIQYQICVFRRKSPDLMVYGLTIKEGEMYLVTQSSAEWPSLVSWLSTQQPESSREQVILSLINAVRRLHTAGIFQLFLNPKSIKIRWNSEGKHSVILPAIPILTSECISSVCRYSAPEVLSSLNSPSLWEELNWRKADAYSVLLLSLHISTGYCAEEREGGSVLPALRESERCREILAQRLTLGAELETHIEQTWSQLRRYADISDFLTQRK